MRRRDLLRAAAAGALIALTAVVRADDALFRYRAPVTLERAAPFVQLALPVSVYAHSRQSDLRDLRLIEARGERVPFALLEPREGGSERVEQGRYASLYALPPRPASAGAEWPSPVEVTINGDKVQVQRRGTATATVDDATSPGWLIDLGDPGALRTGDPRPELMRLAWSGPAEFSAAFSLETIDDLKVWRPGGSGQLLELATEGRTLSQPDVPLPDGAGRFVRLLWQDPAAAPRVTSVRAIGVRRDRSVLDPPTELVAAPLAASAPADAHALDFDLGAGLPIETLDLRLAAGTRVVPLRWQGRERTGAPWRELGAGVVYRIERAGAVSRAPPLRVGANARYVRALPDERAGALDPATTRLVAQVRLATMVFANQGSGPFVLLAGADAADPTFAGGLPIASLVPSLDDERARFGEARLGEWHEVPDAARRAEEAERRAAWRPWLLWTVLVAGVGGLAWMVWRLAREGVQR